MTRNSNIALVVPSIREHSLKTFIEAWGQTRLFQRVDLILIEDNPTRTFDCLEAVQHFSWKEIDDDAYMVGDENWTQHVIPRRSDTVRSFGYWWAWKAGYEYIMTLDDDCLPQKPYEKLDEWHLKMLEPRTMWFNTLTGGRPRGIPYENLGVRNICVNHGLWMGSLDFDAPQQLVAPFEEDFKHDNRIVTPGAYFPFCGMNAAWRADATVLMYHLLMGQTVNELQALTKLPFDRFGDIWCGIIMKKIADHLGWCVTSGTPYIYHSRASNPFTNLRKEANGIEVNEWLWQKIDAIDLGAFKDPIVCYQKIADTIYCTFKGEHEEYWKKLGSAMSTWAGLF